MVGGVREFVGMVEGSVELGVSQDMPLNFLGSGVTWEMEVFRSAPDQFGQSW